MSEAPPEPPRSRGIALLLLVILVGAASCLFYGAGFEASLAGWSALVAIPAALGGLFALLSDPTGKQPIMGCFVWPTVGLTALVGLAWLVVGEGAICIAMVLPLWIPAAIGGALINLWNRRRWRKWDRASVELYGVAWIALPLVLIVAEFGNPPQWREQIVSRQVIVDAAPDEVWPLLASIPDIRNDEGRWNTTQDLLGVPRPLEAVIVRQGRHIVRKARWGDDIRFEERIIEWWPGEAIGWTFAFPDQSIQQHTDQHISPDGPMLRIVSGRYEMAEIANGKTKVQLTTTYRMRTRLPAYIAWWGDHLLGDIQTNVLAIIKDRAEA